MQEKSLEEHVDFKDLESRVFIVFNKSLYIGGKEVPKELRSQLKEQATYIAESQLWEILNATIINEASNMSLMQSTNWEHIQTAKMLHHWGYVFRRMIEELKQ